MCRIRTVKQGYHSEGSTLELLINVNIAEHLSASLCCQINHFPTSTTATQPGAEANMCSLANN